MSAVVWIVVVIGVCIWLLSRPTTNRQRSSPPTTPRVAPRPRTPTTERNPDVIGGLIAGHFIAHGHDGFPGDPLPNGHLGSAANLAFWSMAFDEEDDD
jgi:hypothetical protein